MLAPQRIEREVQRFEIERLGLLDRLVARAGVLDAELGQRRERERVDARAGPHARREHERVDAALGQLAPRERLGHLAAARVRSAEEEHDGDGRRVHL
jgi:hypothetical protein